MESKELEDGEITSEHEGTPKPDYNNENVIDQIVRKENDRRSESPSKNKTERKSDNHKKERSSRNEKSDRKSESRRHESKKSTTWQSGGSNRNVRAPPLDSIIFPPTPSLPQIRQVDPAIFRLQSIAMQPRIDYPQPFPIAPLPPPPRQNFHFFPTPPVPLPPPPAPPVLPVVDYQRDNYEEVGMDLCDERRTPEEPSVSPEPRNVTEPVQIPLQKVPDVEEHHDVDTDALRAQLLSQMNEKKRAAQQTTEIPEEPVPKKSRSDEEEKSEAVDQRKKKRELRLTRRKNMEEIGSARLEMVKAQEEFNRAIAKANESFSILCQKRDEIKQKKKENRDIGVQIDKIDDQEMDVMCDKSMLIPLVDMDSLSTPSTAELSEISDEEEEEPREVNVQSKASNISIISEVINVSDKPSITGLSVEQTLREKLLAKQTAQARKSPELKEIGSSDPNSTSSSTSQMETTQTILTKLCKFELNGVCEEGQNCLRLHLQDINDDKPRRRELISRILGDVLQYQEADIDPATDEILDYLPHFKTFSALFQCFLSTVMRRDEPSRVRLSEFFANRR